MELREFFDSNPSCALAFSGGVDSSYLLYSASRWCKKLGVYYVKSLFQPQFELDDAKKLCDELGVTLNIIEADVLSDPTVVSNPSDRCYYCKRVIFEKITEKAREDGFELVIEGTNASDDIDDRPGYRALGEMKAASPLRLCGLTKDMIRELSREAGLFTWNKPSYACLATRIPTGEQITAEKLRTTEEAEGILMQMGFTDFRIRMVSGVAKIQLRKEQFPLLAQKREDIVKLLSPMYKGITLDLEARNGE